MKRHRKRVSSKDKSSAKQPESANADEANDAPGRGASARNNSSKDTDKEHGLFDGGPAADFDIREGAGTDSPGRVEQAEPMAEAQVVQLQDKLLRLRADFDNFRKRSLREQTLLCDMANQELMLELLPVLDHFQLAIKAAAEHEADAKFREGLEMVFEQLMGVLSKFGLEPVDAERHPFDINVHEAINYLPSDEHPESTVIAQVRRGYLLKNRLLRPAQVIVSSGSAGSRKNEADSSQNS